MSVLTPTLLRLSQYEADTVSKNGDYLIDLAQAVTLYPGDTVTPYQCLIDTQRQDEDTIFIDQDISVSVTFMYYEQNTDFTDKTAIHGGATDADNELYLMYHSDASTPGDTSLHRFSRQIEIQVEQGSYTPAAIAELLTDRFSNTQSFINETALSTGNNLLIATDTGSGGGAVTSLEEFSWGNSPTVFASIPNLDGDATAWGQVGGPNGSTNYYLGNGVISNTGYRSTKFPGGSWVSINAAAPDVISEDSHDTDFHITSTGTNGTGSGLTIRILPREPAPGVVRAGWYGPNVKEVGTQKMFYEIVDGGSGYQRGDEVYFDYTLFAATDAEDNLYYRLGSGAYPVEGTTGRVKLVVQSISQTNSYFEFLKVGEDPDSPSNSYRYNSGEVYWIGATEFDLEFNQDGNGLFSFNYLHTPFYKVITDQPLQPAVSIKRTSAPDTNSVLSVDCGVALVNLSPRSFWEGILNFDVDSIILKDVNGKPVYGNGNLRTAIPTLDNARTSGYLGLNGFLVNTTGAPIRKIPAPGAASNTPIATTLTNAINSGEYQTNSGSGYYLIELEGGWKQEMVMGQRKLQCSAVVSRQYNSNEMVTAYQESAIPYVHQGVPITFKQLKVRILEPDSNPPTVPDDLGANNSIFVRIDRAPRMDLETPPKPKSRPEIKRK